MRKTEGYVQVEEDGPCGWWLPDEGSRPSIHIHIPTFAHYPTVGLRSADVFWSNEMRMLGTPGDPPSGPSFPPLTLNQSLLLIIRTVLYYLP